MSKGIFKKVICSFKFIKYNFFKNNFKCLFMFFSFLNIWYGIDDLYNPYHRHMSGLGPLLPFPSASSSCPHLKNIIFFLIRFNII